MAFSLIYNLYSNERIGGTFVFCLRTADDSYACQGFGWITGAQEGGRFHGTLYAG
jgi:hypothetical protein